MGSFLAFAVWRKDEGARRGLYTLSLALLFVALFTKQTTITMVGTLAAWWPLRLRRTESAALSPCRARSRSSMSWTRSFWSIAPSAETSESSIGLSSARPDRIRLFRRPILDEWADGEDSLEHLVAHIVVHEVGHHFGLSDEDMHTIEEGMA